MIYSSFTSASKMVKKLLGIVSVFLITSMLTSATPTNPSRSNDKYDINKIYEKVSLKSGTKVINSYGNIDDATALLVPTELESGQYKVELTRIDKDMYQICGTSIYIETRYCYEYATYDEAILIIDTSYGIMRGEVIFLN